LDFAIVQAAGKKHGAVKANENFAVQTVKFAGVQFGCFYAGLYRHSVGPHDDMKSLSGGRVIIAKRCLGRRGGFRRVTARFLEAGDKLASFQGVEPLEGFGEGRLALADDLWGGTLE